MNYFILILSTALSLIASADPVTISDRRCLSAPIDHVVKATTDYTNYAKIPEATLSLIGLTILKMTKSQEVRKVPGSSDDSLVYIELRPLNMGEAQKDLYPRFFIRCKMIVQSATSFRHECHSLTTQDLTDYGRPGALRPPFGLAHFDSNLQIDAQSANCAAEQTQITYKLVMEPNDADVTQIQVASGFGTFPLPQDQFFKAYYQNFYSGWTKTIK